MEENRMETADVTDRLPSCIGKGHTMTIAEMKERKIALGYTNEMIAQMSGVPLSTVQKVFAGITVRPRYDTLRALEKVFLNGEERLAGGSPEPERIPDGDASSGQADEDRGGCCSGDGQYPAEAAGTGIGRVLEGNCVYHTERSGGSAAGKEPGGEEPGDRESPTGVHQILVFELYRLLREYILSVNGSDCPVGGPVDVQLIEGDKAIVQPDVMILSGRSRLKENRIVGAPDFIAEILSPSTKSSDLFRKPALYRGAGVKEYWIIDPDREQIVVYDFRHDDRVNLYDFQNVVPVNLYEGKCRIDFREIREYLRQLQSRICTAAPNTPSPM